MSSSPDNSLHRKNLGQFFTPEEVASSLVRWVVKSPKDQMLDPSCGDGAFLRWHKRSVGIEVDVENAALARQNAPGSLVHGGDFFLWAVATKERFDAIAGNPPFIRYQSFSGEIRQRALRQSAEMGAEFSALTSSWAPFVLVAAGLLKPGGRMAFVVPAEIGHSNYVRPLIPSLCAHFARVQVIACREKFFPALSEDCWLLHCDGYGRSTNHIALSLTDVFRPTQTPPPIDRMVSLAAWREVGERIRPFLLSESALKLYQKVTQHASVTRLGELAHVGIGYVTGDNDFFHLRPSEARARGIPKNLLRPAIRKGDQLPKGTVAKEHVNRWISEDSKILLLDLNRADALPTSVERYLDEEAGREARKAFKCRTRDPWYAVPDVKVPDAFLTVMCGAKPALVRNDAACVCTNTLHAVRFKAGAEPGRVQQAWNSAISQLGAEIEGHPLGGGMLKLEPREATRIPIPLGPIKLTKGDTMVLDEAVTTMRAWRHNGEVYSGPVQTSLFAL